MSNQLQILQRRLDREIRARKAAELILEQKALELYESNESLRSLNAELEQRIKSRTQALHRSEVKYRSIIENMELGLVEVDNHGLISSVYNNFNKMTGYQGEELIGQNAKETLLAPGFEKVLSKFYKNYKTGVSATYQIQIKKKNGDLIWVLVSGAPFINEENKVIGWVGVHYDITKEVQLQEALEQAEKDALQTQLAEQQFLANMSHEIRTPLNAIIGMSHLIAETRLDEKQSKFTRSLTLSANNLKALIDDVLDLAKIKSGRLEVTKTDFNLYSYCKDLVESYDIRNQQRNVAFRLKYDPEEIQIIHSDGKLILQILNNLISNAEKFTPEGHVELSVHIDKGQSEDPQVRLIVKDTGIGLAAEDLQSVFDRFKQSANTTTKTKGTGLGLTITHRIIELMGGSIIAKSQLGMGSEFAVSLPIQIVKTTTSPKINPVSSNKKISNKNILVVEDTPMNQIYIESIFESIDCQYDIVESGHEAIAICKQKQYDIILMDIQMPGIDGLETTRRLRSIDSWCRSVPIIAVSAAAFQANIDEALDSGATAFLAKPFTPNQLREVLQEYLAIDKNNTSIDSDSSFNLSFIKEYFDGNIDQATKIIQVFIDNIDGYMLDIDSAISENDHESLRATTHKIVPMLTMVGQGDCATQLESLKAASKVKDYTSAQNIHTQIIENITSIKGQLNNYLIQNKVHQ